MKKIGVHQPASIKWFVPENQCNIVSTFMFLFEFAWFIPTIFKKIWINKLKCWPSWKTIWLLYQMLQNLSFWLPHFKILLLPLNWTSYPTWFWKYWEKHLFRCGHFEIQDGGWMIGSVNLLPLKICFSRSNQLLCQISCIYQEYCMVYHVFLPKFPYQPMKRRMRDGGGRDATGPYIEFRMLGRSMLHTSMFCLANKLRFGIYMCRIAQKVFDLWKK